MKTSRSEGRGHSFICIYLSLRSEKLLRIPTCLQLLPNCYSAWTKTTRNTVAASRHIVVARCNGQPGKKISLLLPVSGWDCLPGVQIKANRNNTRPRTPNDVASLMDCSQNFRTDQSVLYFCIHPVLLETPRHTKVKVVGLPIYRLSILCILLHDLYLRSTDKCAYKSLRIPEFRKISKNFLTR